ncbi:hypothetical protein HDK90DRAFT_153410 [Phyllosticta capitalensis]|uniref:Uncharacterized protein n=1 Tax=Phyllosticta capitalensis TaxID=121624 RepID=A0ABR1Z073_9PEZI
MSKRKAERASSADWLDGSPRKRVATLYDAVAGRVTSNGFMSAEPFASKERDTASSSRKPLRPDEVLFKMRNAPERFAESDPYDADRHLGQHQRLPDSDLVKALHAYASDFYNASFGKSSKRDYKSMDETALLALGILVEEAAVELLGPTGDLAFVEGEKDHMINMSQAWNGMQWTRSVVEVQATRGSGPEDRQSEPKSDTVPSESISKKQRSSPEFQSQSARSGLDDDSATDDSQNETSDSDSDENDESDEG